MSSSNQYQSQMQNLQAQAIINAIIYKPTLVHLGTAQGQWTPKPYMNATRDVLKISMDDIQKQKNSLSDNVFRRIGIVATKEEISINPLTLEIAESGFANRNIADVIPMVLSELNEVFDSLNAASLDEKATAGSDITFDCAPKLINEIIKNINTLNNYDVVKHLIIPVNVHTALISIGNHLEQNNWYLELQNRLNALNTTLRVSSAVESIFLIIDPLLAEYQGEMPLIAADGHDPRLHEYWMQFRLSGSDFKPRHKNALQKFKITGLENGKISQYTCSKGS